MSSRKSTTLARALALGLLMPLLAPVVATAAGAETAGVPDDPSAVAVTEEGIPLDSRAQLLGGNWEGSDDTVSVVLGDANGLMVLRAARKDGYAWGSVAALPTDSTAQTDMWISNSCVTSTGNFLVVVYSPRGATNDAEGFGGSGHAVVVDLRTGAVTDLGIGYTIAYFNPGCGEGDSFALTRFESEFQHTRVATVNAATGEVLGKFEIPGEATSAISRLDGSVLAASEAGIIAVRADSKPTVVVASDRLIYDLALDAQGRLAYVELEKNDINASVHITAPDGQEKSLLVATGPVTEIGVQTSQKGDFFILGDSLEHRAPDAPGVRYLPAAGPGSTISGEGKLVIDAVLPAGVGRATSADEPSLAVPRIAATAVDSRTTLNFQLGSILPAPGIQTFPVLRGGGLSVGASSSGNDTVLATDIHLGAGLLPMGDPHDPSDSERSCAVARNDTNNQAYQPKPRQVEWAVDRAVKGQLTEVRPADWRGLGMPSYSPQSYFPRVTLVGGGTIPPQIVLGVLMQESNIWQADRYTSPGNTGNPLIGDYYGNRGAASIWDIDFPGADCGYGVGQITDGMRATDTSLTANQQRAIALDYEANVAMTVRMLGQKWSEAANAGMQVNNGAASRVENWFFAVWTYNTGFHPYVNSSTPWGVGWFNNPVNPIYPASRLPFLESSQMDAVTPQYWPYPEKVIGWAAWGTSLPETVWADSATRTYTTHFVSSYTTAWWNTEADRTQAKPPRTKFCSLSVNNCNPSSSAPCQLSSDECWWHTSATWKTSCNTYCGQGNERFDSTYATEASSMASTLPAVTLQSSFPANCSSPPSGVVVVDDTTDTNARNSGECTNLSTAGTFTYTFSSPNSNGSYPAKIDLHQQGGGFNGHFSFAHMQANPSMVGYPGAQATVTGTWNRGVSMSGTWTRVWVHLPDYAAWSQQAAYTINFGDGTSQTRYLPQRRYHNEWVSLGVFQMKGTPSVSLSNTLTSDFDPDSALFDGMHLGDVEDVAWDAVGFQALSAKPGEFVVALGDSFSSGEGAGAYDAWSDNNGSELESRNSCHQSANAWIRKTILPGRSSSIGALAASADASLDFHFLACSGAESEQLLPYYTATGVPPENAEGQDGRSVQWSMISQLDAGYLDSNTTLVTLSIGGNDARFAAIVQECVNAYLFVFGGDCSGAVLPGDTAPAIDASADRVANEIPTSVAAVLQEIRNRAPNAKIALVGYPKLFETGSACVGIAEDNLDWLNDLTDDLNDALAASAAAADTPSGPDVFFVDPRPQFSGSNLCTATSAINGLVAGLTPGEHALLHIGNQGYLNSAGWVSQQSVHPNELGTDLYTNALEAALALHP